MLMLLNVTVYKLAFKSTSLVAPTPFLSFSTVEKIREPGEEATLLACECVLGGGGGDGALSIRTC